MICIRCFFVLCGTLAAAALTGCSGLAVSQATHDFGKVLVGATSPPVEVYWTNNTADEYTIVLWRMPVGPFAARTPADQTVAAGASTGNASITFSPTAVGRAPEAQLRPQTLPRSSPRVRLYGEGVQFLLAGTGLGTTGVTANTAPLDFGRKLINSPPPATITFTITNNTASAMNLAAAMTGGAPVFGVQNASIVVPARDNSTMPPTPGSAAVTLTFAPTAVGEQLGAVEFTGTNLKLGVSLKGTGVAGEEDE